MYIKWLLQAIASFVVSIFCYITNPIVVLFCDKDGELPTWCKYWQTWDDSVYSSDVVHKRELPDFLLYNYNGHYIEHDTCEGQQLASERQHKREAELKRVNRRRWFSTCFNDDWTIKERLQRYICAVYWLTRNCGYGFSFWWFGANAYGDDICIDVDTDELTVGRSIYDTRIFIYKDSRKAGSCFGYDIYWNIFAGWKLDLDAKVLTRAMIAHRIAIKIRKAVE